MTRLQEACSRQTQPLGQRGYSRRLAFARTLDQNANICLVYSFLVWYCGSMISNNVAVLTDRPTQRPKRIKPLD